MSNILDKLDRQETKLTNALVDKLMVGFYDYSLADLRDMIAAAAAEIRRQGEVNRKLGDALTKTERVRPPLPADSGRAAGE